MHKLCLALIFTCILSAETVNLSNAVVVIRPGELPNAEKTAALVLTQEIEKRTGIHLAVQSSWPKSAPVIAITSQPNTLPDAETKPEGYRLFVDRSNPNSPIVWVLGADPRGALYGVGQLLRRLDWSTGALSIAAPLDIRTAPAYAIRGHQLGYRAQANSWDAWTIAQYEQYIRELAFFGVNAIENIPFQDERPTPVMKVSRREMNRAMSEICDRYGLDYWVWVPADFDLRDAAKRTKSLEDYRQFFADTKSLAGLFFPGGDPGNNPPELVMPYLEDVAKLMRPVHPNARIWLSLQQFTPQQVDYSYQWIERESPWWFAGLVVGPSSPSLADARQRVPKQYKLRLYPDLTHNKLSQYQVPLWDQAYALTLGREAINPRPAEYARIFQRTAPYSDGFISYSDGVHDDVNKTIWSALSWDPSTSIRDILIDYARVFFGPNVATESADAILALETNWRGPLVDNGSVEGTLLAWQHLEDQAPQLETNWRWQMCLLRANYDAYVRRRQFNEQRLESEANAVLLKSTNPDEAIGQATEILNRVVAKPESPQLRTRIEDLCEKLFLSIGLQTSVKKYYASGEERGAILDFVDYPLNNRWWLEDEFQKIRQLPSDDEKKARLHAIATWEHPGPGSFYDVVGDIAKSPHAARTEPPREPTFWWWDQGFSRARLTWQVTSWPASLVYDALDPKGKYIVRTSGAGQCLLRINGDRVEPTLDGKQMGEFKEFPVDPKYVANGRLTLTFDRPTNEGHLNWRQHSRLAEVWLLRSPIQ